MLLWPLATTSAEPLFEPLSHGRLGAMSTEPTARERAREYCPWHHRMAPPTRNDNLAVCVCDAIEAAILAAERAAVAAATGYGSHLSCCQDAARHVEHRIAQAERAAVNARDTEWQLAWAEKMTEGYEVGACLSPPTPDDVAPLLASVQREAERAATEPWIAAARSVIQCLSHFVLQGALPSIVDDICAPLAALLEEEAKHG